MDLGFLHGRIFAHWTHFFLNLLYRCIWMTCKWVFVICLYKCLHVMKWSNFWYKIIHVIIVISVKLIIISSFKLLSLITQVFLIFIFLLLERITERVSLPLVYSSNGHDNHSAWPIWCQVSNVGAWPQGLGLEHRAGSEVGRPGDAVAPMWDAGAAGGALARCAKWLFSVNLAALKGQIFVLSVFTTFQFHLCLLWCLFSFHLLLVNFAFLFHDCYFWKLHLIYCIVK